MKPDCWLIPPSSTDGVTRGLHSMQLGYHDDASIKESFVMRGNAHQADCLSLSTTSALMQQPQTTDSLSGQLWQEPSEAMHITYAVISKRNVSTKPDLV